MKECENSGTHRENLSSRRETMGLMQKTPIWTDMILVLVYLFAQVEDTSYIMQKWKDCPAKIRNLQGLVKITHQRGKKGDMKKGKSDFMAFIFLIFSLVGMKFMISPGLSQVSWTDKHPFPTVKKTPIVWLKNHESCLIGMNLNYKTNN